MNKNNSLNIYFRQEFSDRFRSILVDKGIIPCTNTHLAELFEVSPKAARRWLEGSAMPNQHRMVKICEFLGVRIEWLLFGTGPIFLYRSVQEDDAESLTLSLAEIKLIRQYRRMLPKQRGCLVELLESLNQ